MIYLQYYTARYDLGDNASLLVCVLLAVERAHFTVTMMTKSSHAICCPSAHGTDNGLAQSLALRLRDAGYAEREAEITLRPIVDVPLHRGLGDMVCASSSRD